MFVYPRTQLAYDQFQEIEKFSSFMPVKMDIWLEMSKSYSENGLSVAKGVPEKYGKDVSPFGIVVTTFETLKRRMRRPEFIKKMSKHLSTIVVDEVHLLSGISGGMSAKLLSRLLKQYMIITNKFTGLEHLRQSLDLINIYLDYSV